MKIGNLNNLYTERLETGKLLNDPVWIDVKQIPEFLGDTIEERIQKWIDLRDNAGIMLLDEPVEKKGFLQRLFNK